MSSNVRATVSEVLEVVFHQFESSELFYGHGTDNAWDEAVFLVLHLMGLPMDSGQSALALAVPEDCQILINVQVNRRIVERIPLPYLTGVAWFAGMEFICDSRAIIPRSPVAELIANNFQPWYRGPSPRLILDLCCGGGCIGIACAASYPNSKVDLLDLDNNALALATENIAKFALNQRVKTIKSDLYDAISGRRYDLIVSNPPYVDSEDIESMPAEYLHEPGIALVSGVDGLDITRKILRQAESYLSKDGLLVVEVGNSREALEYAFPKVPFTWIEFAQGGHGVFVFTAEELRSYQQWF